MSTTLESRKAKQNYAEFDEYISFQLQKTQTGIRSTDIFTALCGAAVFVISYLLVFVIFDHWVITGGFGSAMRVVLLAGLLVGTLAWLGWKVLWPCFRRVNSLYAAKALEKASPDLKSTLLNYVDLRSANREVAPAVIGSMEKRAAVTLSHAEVDDAIDRSTLLRLSYALLVSVVLFSVYAIASPKKVWPSIVRIFAPAAEVSVSTQTAFLSVDPGDAQVLAREFLTITTDLSGEVPQDVTLLYTTNDQQFVDESVSMHEVEAGLKRYRCILKGNGGEGLLQGLSYRIVAGDASTRNYTVTVAQPPSASVKALRYTYPDYMELPATHTPGANIDTWEGTQIEVQATVNMPIEMAWLQFSDEAEFPARCEELRMKVAEGGTRVTGLWQPIVREDGTHPTFYRIQCKTADGATDPTPPVHTIRINADQKPEVSTLQPNADTEVAVNAIVPLLIQASDPDFRLSRVLLRMQNGPRSLPDRTLYNGNDTRKRILFDLKIAELNARPGDVITWWIEAHDNRRVETPVRTLLDANRSTSPRLKFIIKEPQSEEDVNEQREHDKQRAQEKLDELDQQNGNIDQSPGSSDAGISDQEPDVNDNPASDSNDPNRKKDDVKPDEEPPADKRNTEGDEKGAGGQSDGDSRSQSNNQNDQGTSDQTGKSISDKSKNGKGQPSEADADTNPRTGDQKTESGPRKPVSNDGSQDDQILRELLKQNRESKNDTGNDDGQGDSGKQDDGKKNDSPEVGGESDSPQKNGDTPADDPLNKEPGESGTQPEDKASEPGASPDTEKSQKGGTDGNKPNGPSGDASKDNQKENSPGDPEQSGTQDKSSDSEKPPSDDSKGMPSNSQSGNAGDTDQRPDGSGEKPSSDPAKTPGSNMPDSKNGSDNDGNVDSASSEKPSGRDTGNAQSQDSGSDKGSDKTDSKPGDQPGGSSDQPGKGGSENKGGGDSNSARPDGGASSKHSPAGNPDKGGAGTDPAGNSQDSGGAKPSADGGNKTDADSAAGKPGQADTDKPGTGQPGDPNDDGQSGSKSGAKDAQKKPGEGGGEGQKPGDATGGNPGDTGSPGEPTGKSGNGKPGGEVSGESGSGQNAQPGAKSGPGGNGDEPRVGSDSSGSPVKRPGDNADPNEALQRDRSGANVHDPNLPDADQANLEDKLKASNMVLKRLKEELDRGEVDPELLKKLGWTEKDMQQFAERLERQLAQPKPDDPAADARRRQFEEVLRSVDLESSGRQQEGNFNDQKSTNNFSDRRLKAPRAHRKAYEEYLKRLSRQRRRTSPSGS